MKTWKSVSKESCLRLKWKKSNSKYQHVYKKLNFVLDVHCGSDLCKWRMTSQWTNSFTFVIHVRLFLAAISYIDSSNVDIINWLFGWVQSTILNFKKISSLLVFKKKIRTASHSPSFWLSKCSYFSTNNEYIFKTKYLWNFI